MKTVDFNIKIQSGTNFEKLFFEKCNAHAPYLFEEISRHLKKVKLSAFSLLFVAQMIPEHTLYNFFVCQDFRTLSVVHSSTNEYAQMLYCEVFAWIFISVPKTAYYIFKKVFSYFLMRALYISGV